MVNGQNNVADIKGHSIMISIVANWVKKKKKVNN